MMKQAADKLILKYICMQVMIEDKRYDETGCR